MFLASITQCIVADLLAYRTEFVSHITNVTKLTKILQMQLRQLDHRPDSQLLPAFAAHATISYVCREFCDAAGNWQKIFPNGVSGLLGVSKPVKFLKILISS